MNASSEVSFCGMYCPNCGVRCHLPQRASALIEEMKVGEYDKWGHSLEGFTPFWKFLHGLADENVLKRCREETCGAQDCAMRNCAQEKDVYACPLCVEYPCEMIDRFSVSNPTLLFDGKRMKEIGIQAWIAEQEARRRAGFCYGDIRCGQDIFPDD
jgi:hypothetical protein